MLLGATGSLLAVFEPQPGLEEDHVDQVTGPGQPTLGPHRANGIISSA